MNYPNSPGYARKSDTSREAAESLSGHRELSLTVLKVIYAAANHGLIVDEAKVIVERAMERDFDRSTIAARFSELKNQGYIEETAERRKTQRQKNATVFRITIKGRDRALNN